MKKITVVEVQVVVAVAEGDEPLATINRVNEAALSFKKELGDVAQFNVLTREVPVQEDANGPANQV